MRNIRPLNGPSLERAAPAPRPAALDILPADSYQAGPSPDQAAGRWPSQGGVPKLLYLGQGIYDNLVADGAKYAKGELQ